MRKKLAELIAKVIAEKRLQIPLPYVEEMLKLVEQAKVPARRECVQNFIAAYLVSRGLMSARTADRVVSSSSKGRRHWQKKLKLLEGERGWEASSS